MVDPILAIARPSSPSQLDLCSMAPEPIGLREFRMNVLAWILSGPPLAFIGAGTTKLLTPRESLPFPRMGWAGDFTSAQIPTDRLP